MDATNATSSPDLAPGLGRRDFLKLFGAVISAAAAGPLAPVVISDDLYINRKLGFAFIRPYGWRYESLQAYADMRDQYEVYTADAELEAEFKGGVLPVAVVTQAPDASMSPTFTVYAEENLLKADEKLMDVFPFLSAHFARLFRDFKVIGGPAARQVCGYESLEYLSTFAYVDSRGYRGPVRNRGLITARGPLLYTFNMLDIPRRGMDTQQEFDRVVESIKYV